MWTQSEQTIKWLFCLITMPFLFGGCSMIQPRIPGSGISRSEYRQIQPFDEIELNGIGTVNVVAGSQPSLRVTTDDNLMQWVATEVKNGKLQIKPLRKIRPHSGLVIDVTVPNLTAARLTGAGDLNVDGVVSNQLELSISGAGELTARGQVAHISTKISGAGSANLQDLIAESAEVKISGAGNVDLYATKSIDARISGAGNVVCYGNPTDVKQQVSGVGSVQLR